MWRKCGRVSAMGHLAACFRRTWEIKVINICSLSAVPTPPCPLSGVHGVHMSVCPLCDLQVVAHAPFRSVFLRFHLRHCHCLLPKSLEFWGSARINHTPWHLSRKLSVYGPLHLWSLDRLGLEVQMGCARVQVAFLVYKHHYALFPPRELSNSYSFNCHLSCVSGKDDRKVCAHGFGFGFDEYVCVWPIWVMMTFMLVLWTASTESSFELAS